MGTLISDELRWAADQIVNHSDYPSAVLSGLAPDPRHLENGGFHCSIDDLKAHGNQGDYSNTRANDKGFNPQYGAAFDVSVVKADMVKIYARIRAAWVDRADPRRGYVNAINCWDGTGDATRFDFDANVAKYASPDHQWHTHGEIHRRYVRDAKAARAVVSMFRGESKTAWIAREEPTKAQEDDMPFTIQEVQAAAKAGFVSALADGYNAAMVTSAYKEATPDQQKAMRNTRDFLQGIVGGPTEDDIAAAQVILISAIGAGNTAAVDKIVQGVVGGLPAAQIAAAVVAAMPADQARKVADELAARLAA